MLEMQDIAIKICEKTLQDHQHQHLRENIATTVFEKDSLVLMSYPSSIPHKLQTKHSGPFRVLSSLDLFSLTTDSS